MKCLLISAALVFAATWAAAAPAQAPLPAWTPCALEGQTCYTPGPAQVRMGSNGRYSAPQNAVGNIECSTAQFGEPGFRGAKLCEYQLGWARGLARPSREANDGDWTACANEGELCRFRGTRLVRFGAEGAYYYRTESREIACATEEFGDPVRRVPKQCQFKRADDDRNDGRGNAAWRDNNNNNNDRGRGQAQRPANRWEMCAVERETCRVSEPTLVRFGREGAYNYRQVDAEAYCSPNVFSDPAPGLVKVCEANTVSVRQSMARRPDADEIPPLDDRLWTDCAAENQVCNFRGGEHVRFGASGVFKVVHATDGLRCTASSFGGDPVEGVRKRCAIYRP